MDIVGKQSVTQVGTRFLLSARRSLVNPGDRKKPTRYYSYSKQCQYNPGSVTRYSWYGSPTTSVDPTLHLAPGTATFLGFDASVMTNSPSGSPLYQDLYRKQLSKLLAKVQEKKGNDLNLGVFFAEADKSMQMIINAAKRITRAVRSARKGNFKEMYRHLGAVPRKGKASTKDPANAWLEAKYGWMPLLQDAYSAGVKLAKMVEAKPPIVRVRATGNTERSSSVSVNQSPGGKRITNVFEKLILKLQLHYTVSNSTLALASSFGLTNPMLIAWETVPLSFVLDWFLPIGTFLEELTAFHGLSFHSGFTTALWTYETIATATAYNVASEWNSLGGGQYGWRIRETSSGSSSSCKDFGFTRNLWTDFPLPNFPTLNFKPTWAKAATVLSLIRQRHD